MRSGALRRVWVGRRRQRWPSGLTSRAAASSSGRSVEVLVKLAEVVGGGHEPPFGTDGGAAGSLELREAAVVFGVAEDRLDRLAALLVELAAEVAREHRAHEVVGAAVPAGPFGLVLAAAGVGRDQHCDAVAGDRVHLL